jgi:aryl-alcohol dehydrogenase-like predicted oxidoreductase
VDRLSGFDFLPYDRERAFDLIDLLRSIGAKRGASPAQVSLAWLLTRPAVSSILVGASSVAQLDENLKATDVKLEADDLSALDEATKPVPPYPHWFTPRVVDSKVYDALGLPLAVRPVR